MLFQINVKEVQCYGNLANRLIPPYAVADE